VAEELVDELARDLEVDVVDNLVKESTLKLADWSCSSGPWQRRFLQLK